jgi:hypothetical protein
LVVLAWLVGVIALVIAGIVLMASGHVFIGLILAVPPGAFAIRVFAGNRSGNTGALPERSESDRFDLPRAPNWSNSTYEEIVEFMALCSDPSEYRHLLDGLGPRDRTFLITQVMFEHLNQIDAKRTRLEQLHAEGALSDTEFEAAIERVNSETERKF